MRVFVRVCVRARTCGQCACVCLSCGSVCGRLRACVRACVRGQRRYAAYVCIQCDLLSPNKSLTTPTVRESLKKYPASTYHANTPTVQQCLGINPGQAPPPPCCFVWLFLRAGGASDDLLRTCRPHEKLLRACYAVSHQQAAEEKVAQSIENATLERFGACDPRVPCSTTRVPAVPCCTLEHPVVPLAAAAWHQRHFTASPAALGGRSA